MSMKVRSGRLMASGTAPLTAEAPEPPVMTVTGGGLEIHPGTGHVIGLHSDPARDLENVPETSLEASIKTSTWMDL